jgi:hypothetical protein
VSRYILGQARFQSGCGDAPSDAFLAMIQSAARVPNCRGDERSSAIDFVGWVVGRSLLLGGGGVHFSSPFPLASFLAAPGSEVELVDIVLRE